MKGPERPFSSYGSSKVSLTAQGVDIEATVPGDSYKAMSGTSMATPILGGASMLLLAVAAREGASDEQVAGALRHEEPHTFFAEVASGQSSFKSKEEYLKMDAQDILTDAAAKGVSARAVLDQRAPVNDEMPMLFRSDADRDEYFQSRLDRRAELVQALQTLEAAPDFQGTKTDWSNEKTVNLSELDPAEKQQFYAGLDTLNQAYYNKVITTLT